MNALIVDDNAAGRKVLRYYLQSQGATVSEAANGREALDLAAQQAPDLIISDAQMPVMDGYQLLREIRGSSELRDILFIFYSAVYTGEHDRELAMELGADAFIVKPKDPQEFWTELKTSLEQARKEKRRVCEQSLLQEEKFLRRYSAVLAGQLDTKVEKLRQSEHLFRATFENAPVGIAHVLPDGKWETFNGTLCRILGYSAVELAKMNFQQITPEVELPEDMAALQEFLAGERQIFKREKHYIHKDGHLVWVNLTATLEKDQHGQPNYFICIIEDIGERKAMETRLREALEASRSAEYRLSELLRTLVDGLIICDGDHRICFANQAAEDLLGFRLCEHLHQPAEAALESETLKRSILEAHAGSPPSVVQTSMMHRRLGIRRDIQILTTASPGEIQKERGTITLLRDITAERESDRLKSEFISTAAHELRTPLASVMGYAELLLEMEERNEELLQESLNIIAEKSLVLEKIIDDLLDLSRVESGHTVNLNRQDCDLAMLLSHLEGQYHTRLPDHRIEVNNGPPPLWVCADPIKVTQVLDNLVNNAVKFSDKGTCIRIHCEASGTEVKVSVQDEGIGMSPEEAAKAFEKFYRADASHTARQGLGLGLAIVKNIIEAHGGHVGLNSRKGEGTEVWFTLPRGHCSEQG